MTDADQTPVFQDQAPVEDAKKTQKAQDKAVAEAEQASAEEVLPTEKAVIDEDNEDLRKDGSYPKHEVAETAQADLPREQGA